MGSLACSVAREARQRQNGPARVGCSLPRADGCFVALLLVPCEFLNRVRVNQAVSLVCCGVVRIYNRCCCFCYYVVCLLSMMTALSFRASRWMGDVDYQFNPRKKIGQCRPPPACRRTSWILSGDWEKSHHGRQQDKDYIQRSSHHAMCVEKVGKRRRTFLSSRRPIGLLTHRSHKRRVTLIGFLPLSFLAVHRPRVCRLGASTACVPCRRPLVMRDVLVWLASAWDGYLRW
jgi:hypothetical protein